MLRSLLRCGAWCAALALMLEIESPAEAGSWIFNRSYYSHTPVHPTPVGPRVRGGPLYSRDQGAYVQYGFRNLRSSIIIRGQTVDNYNQWEYWVQDGVKF